MLKRMLLCVAVTGHFLFSWSGLVITLETKHATNKKISHSMNMYISQKNVSMEILTAENKGNTIFRGDKEVFWIVDHRKKEYTEIDKKTIESAAAAMSEVMKSMEAQMAQLPPEQRALMEQMMKSHSGAMRGASPLSLKETGQKKVIGGYPCTRTDVYNDTVKVSEMWMTKWENIDNGREAVEAFEAMSVFFKRITDMYNDAFFTGAFQTPYTYANKMNGFPVMTVEYRDNAPVSEMVFKSIQKKDVDNQQFNPPPDYTVKKLQIPEMK